MKCLNPADATVRLRAMEPEDLDFLYSIENDDDLWEVGITNAPYSRYTLTSYIVNNTNDIYTDRQVRFVMENQEGRAVGMLDITHFDPRHLRAEIGIVVADHDRNQGYGRQALCHAIDYCRDILHLHQVFAIIDKGNSSSLALFRSVGFQEGAVLRQWLFGHEKYTDAVLMQIFL